MNYYKLLVFSFLLYACNGRKTEVLLNNAEKLTNNGNLKEAIVVYNEIINKNNEYALAYAKRGSLKNILNEYNSALNDLDKAIILDSNNSGFYVTRGQIKKNINDLYGAVEDYYSAIHLDSNSIALNNLGMLKMKFNDFSSALNFFNASISLNDTMSMTFNNRGTLKEKMGDSKEAIKDYDNAIRLDSTVSLYYYNRSITKHKLEDLIGAVNDLNRAIKIEPSFSDFYYYRGIVYKKLDSLNLCCKDFEKAMLLGNEEARKDYEELCNKSTSQSLIQ